MCTTPRKRNFTFSACDAENLCSSVERDPSSGLFFPDKYPLHTKTDSHHKKELQFTYFVGGPFMLNEFSSIVRVTSMVGLFYKKNIIGKRCLTVVLLTEIVINAI